jgi:putative transposase
VYLALGATEKQRQAAYRGLFRTEREAEAIADIRPALNQNQVLGNPRFHRKIEKVSGERREARPHGRPRSVPASGAGEQGGQGEWGVEVKIK